MPADLTDEEKLRFDALREAARAETGTLRLIRMMWDGRQVAAVGVKVFSKSDPSHHVGDYVLAVLLEDSDYERLVGPSGETSNQYVPGELQAQANPGPMTEGERIEAVRAAVERYRQFTKGETAAVKGGAGETLADRVELALANGLDWRDDMDGA